MTTPLRNDSLAVRLVESVACVRLSDEPLVAQVQADVRFVDGLPYVEAGYVEAGYTVDDALTARYEMHTGFVRITAPDKYARMP